MREQYVVANVSLIGVLNVVIASMYFLRDPINFTVPTDEGIFQEPQTRDMDQQQTDH